MSDWLHQIRSTDSADSFPPTSTALAEPNGLLAVGGDLSTCRLLAAYRRGIFPWFSDNEPVLWWSPDPRTVFTPGKLHISRRLARTIRKQDFAITLDQAFENVVYECAQPRDGGGGTWLLPPMREAYLELHKLGYAHSIEAWRYGQLVGGLYGVALGKVFFGESMFSRETDMSKIALALLSMQLEQWDYQLIDAQVASPHLFTLGAREISRGEFEKILSAAIPAAPQASQWQYHENLPSSPSHLPQTPIEEN